jgi:hypothetical protein
MARILSFPAKRTTSSCDLSSQGFVSRGHRAIGEGSLAVSRVSDSKEWQQKSRLVAASLAPALSVVQGGCRLPRPTNLARTRVECGSGVVHEAPNADSSPSTCDQSSISSSVSAARRRNRIMAELARCGDTITLDRILLAEEVITLDRVVQESDFNVEDSRIEQVALRRGVLAQRHIEKARAEIGDESEEGKLLSWVLEDCAEMLRREWSDSNDRSSSAR